ncbi:DHS-like NAD/FAD-binding domain-containing protein, partial [Bimuria novae-zelandiae CBS 107.79]
RMNDIQDAIEKLSTKRRIVVIAGAGIATLAGVPDFRSKTGVLGKSGGKSSFDANLVWRTEDAKEGFYRVICDIHTKAREALRRDPTPIYQILKLLKNQGRLVRVYTQNIDDIDVVVLGGTEISPPIKGPWSTVFQLHGSVNHAQCTVCHAIVKNYDPSRFRDGPEACDLCTQRAENRTRSNPTLRQRTPSGILRPHVLLYNETNPDEEATVNCFRSDLKASPDAVVVIRTKLSIPTLHRFTHMLCGDVKRRNGVSVWISNEEPAEKLPNF